MFACPSRRAEGTVWACLRERTGGRPRWLALPDDGNRYEVLEGELFVSPAPSLRHQAVLAGLYSILHPYVEANALGWVLWSPADIEFSPQRLVQPDLFVVPETGVGEPESWEQVTSLLLVWKRHPRARREQIARRS